MSETNDEQVAAILARGVARVRAIETDDDRGADNQPECGDRSDAKSNKRSEVTR